jgi:hypothetical protein
MRVAALACFACLIGGAAIAAPPAPPAGGAPHEVSPVTVFPRTEPPKVTATFPAAGQAIAPGVLVLSVTFDQQMLQTGFDFGPSSTAAGEMPKCLKTPRLLNEGKTFVLLCTTHPGKTYALSFNTRPVGGFANVAEQRAQSASLTFTTTAGEPVRNLEDAMKAASLRNIDMPVQETPQVPDKGGP